MATAFWGKIYIRDQLAGLLRQEPGGRCAFTYDESYIATDAPPIAHTLPVQEAPHYSESGLHPFFDNLVAEGWLRNAQARALGVRSGDRFALLLAFGRDCAGAVSIIDPEPTGKSSIDPADQAAIAALASRASLSGIQPKLMVVKGARGYRPASADATSTHIAKLPSGQLPDIIALEWLTTQTARILLPEEPVVEMQIEALEGIADEALVIRRFDRTVRGEKLHFEEFNQLLNQPSDAKYDGTYEDMAHFIRSTPGCIPAESERLFRRVLVCLLLGNTDAHLKNFAMFHASDGLRLAPCYDLVCSGYYEQFVTIALALSGMENLQLGGLQPKHLAGLCEGYGLSAQVLQLAVEDLGKRLEAAKNAVSEADIGTAHLRDRIIKIVEKRWKGTFASIGKLLSKRRVGDERS